MSSTFEGDLIRPLGLVTLYFGYAEYELDGFLERLSVAGLLPEAWAQRPMGQKLGLLEDAVKNFNDSIPEKLDALLVEARSLIEKRNSLIHGCILSGGRVISGRYGVKEARTSPEELVSLAEQIFSWKERLWSFRCKQVEPVLSSRLADTPPNNSLEHTREK